MAVQPLPPFPQNVVVNPRAEIPMSPQWIAWFNALTRSVGQIYYVTVKQYGAKGDGITDDTAAFNSAIASGQPVLIPPGTYIITNAINCTTKGQLIFGYGRAVSIVQVSATFNLAAQGVFVVSTGEQGPIFQDFKITFVQPNTTIRANLTNYPPAIYAPAIPRFVVDRMAITQAMVGINTTGNAGGFYVNDLQLSAYTTGIIIDGCIDTVRISRTHFWPFDLTANQQTIFFASPTTGISSARCDDLKLSDTLFICNLGINFFQSVSGVTFGTITGCSFDTFNGITMTAGGGIQIAATYFTSGVVNVSALQISGNSTMVMSGCWFFNSNSSATAFVIAQNGGGGATKLTIGDSYFNTGTGDITSVAISNTSGATQVDLANCYFDRAANNAYIRPTVLTTAQAGARLSMNGCRSSDKGTGAGTFISIGQDDYHRVIGNVGPGWTNSFPAAVNGVYQFN